MGVSHGKRNGRRALRAVERDLSAADPHLAGMFLTFTRVNRGEGLPRIERVSDGPARRAWRRVRAFLAVAFRPPEPIGAGLPRLDPPGGDSRW